MRKTLFIIGCILFFTGLFFFAVGFIYAFSTKNLIAKDSLNMRLYTLTILFLVGTYLISNNKPEKED
jgi:hypothetical protein